MAEDLETNENQETGREKQPAEPVAPATQAKERLAAQVVADFLDSTAENFESGLDYFRNLSTIEISMEGNFDVILNEFNKDNKSNLKARPEGYHLTIINPTESKVLSTLTAGQIETLQRINADVQQGVGIEIQGIGFISGSQRDNIRPADKSKKTLYLALNIPALQEFRASLGLPHKDFHATLGFENGDIHMEVSGKDSKGKDIVKPIQKIANPEYQTYANQIRDVSFGSLAGKEKDQPKS